jgi:glucose/arabinose dehydrogenase/mono/diheme cytochrome c family protein
MKKGFAIISSIVVVLMFLFGSCNRTQSIVSHSTTADPATLAKGEESFTKNCMGCHNFLQDGIGPQLAGVTEVTSADWIKEFIRDPKSAIESGDTAAQKLFTRYKAIMPSFGHLSDEELNALIAYIQVHKKQTRKPVEEDTTDIKDPIPFRIPSSDLTVDVELVTQIPPSPGLVPTTRITKLDYQPGTDYLYVLDLRGKLYRLRNGQPEVYMDMATLMPKFISQPGLASGFGSFAFHPDFQKNGLLYTTHSEFAASAKPDFAYSDSIPVLLQWVLTEWETKPGVFPFSGKPREILRIDLPTSIHGIQEIAFNPTATPAQKDYGLLYVGIGDGGSAEIGQPLVSPDPRTVWGSIIRIDPRGNDSANGKYGIPRSNPFSDSHDGSRAREVFAYGFRNPHRMSWSKSGQMFGVNIGEHNIEALNMIMPGSFYGWPIREGTFEERFYNDHGKIYPLPPNDSAFHVTYPVAQFDHDDGAAICGGFEYQGKSIPQLSGKFLFGVIGSGRLFYVNMKDLALGHQAPIKEWNITFQGKHTTLAELCGKDRVDIRFGMDNKKELYILTKADGKIYRLGQRRGANTQKPL